MWRDFTTYFNTYYNAKILFDRTEEEILKQKKDIFVFRGDGTSSVSPRTSSSSQGLNRPSGVSQGNLQSGVNQTTNQFGNQSTTSSTQSGINSNVQSSTSNSGASSSLSTGQYSQDLTKVIEKCSKILQYDKESSYFPDAVFMTGKAFYYQNEYARAQRKFLELAGLGETKYSLENNLWLAKTYLQLRGFDEGLKLIEDVKAEALKRDDNDLFIDASITKISFFIFREEFSEAIKECEQFLTVSPDDETSALVSYQLGKIYLETKNNNNAMEAFASVLKYSPSFEVEFNSRFEHAKLLKVLKRIDESEEELNSLRTKGRYRSYLDQILVELGQIYYEKDKVESAIDIFKDVDSTYKGKPTAAIADVKLGELYEKKYRDYDSSYKYYTKSISLLADKDIQTQTNNKVRNIEKYRQLKTSLSANNLNLAYAQDSTRFYKDSVDFDFAYKQYLEENKQLIDQQSPSGEGQLRDNQSQSQQQEQLRQQQAQTQLLKKLALVKEKDLTPAQRIALGKMKKPTRSKISVDSLGTLISNDLYSIGDIFFSELEVPDSTHFYFSKILTEYPKKPVAVQTMFALGTFYETHGDSVKADSLFRYINDNYEDSAVKKSVMQKLGLIKKDDKNEKTIEDPAKSIYLEGENNYYDKKFNEAVDLFKKIPQEFPLSLYASKSIYYTGMIYENDLKMYDSAAVTYGRLIKEFPKDPLIDLVTAKVKFYESEKEKEKKEAEEKARAKEEAKLPKIEKENIPGIPDSTQTVQKGIVPDSLKTETKLPEIKPGIIPDTTAISPNVNNNAAKDSVEADLLPKQKLLEKSKIKKPTTPDSTKTKIEILE
jgi:TolA-binding protein